MEDMYHNCRWCKYNEGGCCLKMQELLDRDAGIALISHIEDGVLAENIKESISYPKFDTVSNLLSEYGISNKRKKEIINTILEELEYHQNTLIADIADAVERGLDNVDLSDNFQLVDPESFYCKYFC